jgi:hypothetical protein
MNGFHQLKWLYYAIFYYPELLQKFIGKVECMVDICYNGVGVKALSSLDDMRGAPPFGRHPFFS